METVYLSTLAVTSTLEWMPMREATERLDDLDRRITQIRGFL
jgi:hypothetical protein